MLGDYRLSNWDLRPAVSSRPVWPQIADLLVRCRRPQSLSLALLACVVSSIGLLSCGGTPNANDPLGQPPGGPPVSLVVANSDLAVGDNRVSFGLVDREYMPVRPDSVDVRAVYYEPGAPTGQVRHQTSAEFIEWSPSGNRGTFVAQVEFDQAGTATGTTSGIWELHATFDHPPGESLTIGTAVSVETEHAIPFIGEPAPLSQTPTSDNRRRSPHDQQQRGTGSSPLPSVGFGGGSGRPTRRHFIRYTRLLRIRYVRPSDFRSF